MIKLVKYFTIIILIPSSLLAVYKLYKDYQFEKELDQSWRESVAPIKQQYYEALEYSRKVKEARKKEKQLLSQDHYGGKTPEETLAMFVEALKKKDAKLAAKYYLPWEWEEKQKWLEGYINEIGARKFIAAYEKQIINRDPDYFGGVALEIREDENDEYPYYIEFVLNKETGIWKIEKF